MVILRFRPECVGSGVCVGRALNQANQLTPGDVRTTAAWSRSFHTSATSTGRRGAQTNFPSIRVTSRATRHSWWREEREPVFAHALNFPGWMITWGNLTRAARTCKSVFLDGVCETIPMPAVRKTLMDRTNASRDHRARSADLGRGRVPQSVPSAAANCSTHRSPPAALATRRFSSRTHPAQARHSRGSRARRSARPRSPTIYTRFTR